MDVKGCNVDAKGYMMDVKGYSVDAKGYMMDVTCSAVHARKARVERLRMVCASSNTTRCHATCAAAAAELV
eukprot:6731852-Pyramimonas_sp.AAC.1